MKPIFVAIVVFFMTSFVSTAAFASNESTSVSEDRAERARENYSFKEKTKEECRCVCNQASNTNSKRPSSPNLSDRKSKL